MGFFDGLGKAFKAVGDSLGVAYDLATAPFSSDAESKQMMSIAASVNPFYRGYSETMPKIGEGLNALVDNPVGRPIVEGFNTAYTYGVSRPLSTTMMQLGEDLPTALNPEGWRVAWNTSASVSPGQALAAVGSMKLADGNTFRAHSPNDIVSFVEAQNAQPEQDPWFKYTSGTLDFGANLADPLIVAGKAAKLARIKLVTKPLQTAGDAERYLDSARYAKFRSFAQAASSPAELRQVVFRNSAFGAQQAYVLYGVRNDDHAFRLAIRSMLDDEQAYTELARINKDAAAQILTKKTEGDLSILTDREGLPDGHPEALTPDDVAKKDALSKVHVDAAQERVPLDAEMLSDLRGSLLGVGSPRVDRLMKTRATLHQKAVFDRPVILRMSYFMSNDNRHVPRINLNDLNSDRSLRMHMEKGGLGSELIDRYLTEYMGATTPERRFVIAGEAENEIVKKLATDHGIKQEDVDQILKAAANGRAKARSLGQKTNAYMTDEILQKWQADGRMAEFDDNPEMALTWLDEEGAVNVAPVLETQTADFLPLVDPALLRQTFAKESARFQTAYAAGEKGLDMTQEVLNSFHKMWKASALLRLGWPVRALSDEAARRTALWGAAPVMMSAVTGSLNTGRNAFARIRPGITTLSARNNPERIKMLEAMQQDAERAVRADSGELSGLGFSDLTHVETDLPVLEGKPAYQGGPTLYHGTSTPLKGDIADAGTRYGDSGLLFGDGFYTTESRSIAKKYTRKGRSKDPHVYNVTWKGATAPKMFDMDAPAPDFMRQFAQGVADDDYYNMTTESLDELRRVIDDPKASSAHVYLEMKRALGSSGEISRSEADELLGEARHHIEDAGFDGISHMGGAYAAKGRGEAHRVHIFFNGEKIKYDRIEGGKSVIDLRPPADAPVGKYQSVEEALADGRVAVKDHADSVRYLAEMGYAPETEAMLAGALKDGTLTAAQFERKLLEHSLSKVGRDVYTRPSWQAEVMDTALDHHLEINPFSGETKGLARKGKVEVKSKLVSAGDDGHYSNDHLYDFVSENADTLLLPKHSVAIERADGGLKFSILREGDAATEAVPGVQLTGHRIKDLRAAMKEFSKTSRSAVNEGVRVSDGQNTLDFGAPFRDGIMRHLVSAKGSFESMGIRETETNVDRLLSSKSFSAKIEPGDASYKSAWEQTINKQVGQSAIAQKFLEGWDRDSVIAWLNESAEGKQLIRRMPHVGKDTYGWAALVEHMVDTYVPDLTFTVKRDGQEYTESLRKKVLAGRATVDDLRAATNGQMPTVHGEEIQNALGKGELWKFVNKAVDQAYNILGSMPADKASRFPVFAQRYNAHLEILARGSRSMNGHSIATADYGRIERIAQRNALHDVKTWLYDTESTTEFARKMRYLMPFASAWQDSISHWTKIAAVENPASVGYLWNLWQAPEAAGLIVDQNGHELRTENGKSVWYSVDPETGNRTKVDPNVVKDLGKSRYVTFKLPSWASPDIFGKDVRVPIKINKDSFNTFLTASPGAGPVVQFPVNEIIRRHPTLEKSDNELYNWALKEILPFGVQGNSAMTLMPSAVREGIMQWRGEEDDIFNGRMMAIFQTEMTNYSLGKRSSKPSMDEAAKKASSMGVLRLMGALVLPVNPQYTSPYQPYVDAYRQLKAADPQNADAKFYDRYGEEYFWLTNRVTKAVTGVPPTQEGFKASQRYRDLIAEHPELAGLIVGAEGAGEFSKAVYEWQKGAPVAAGDERSQRERLSPRQQVDDIQQRLGWIKYGKLMDSIQADLSDRGLTNVTDQGAEDLLDMRKAWIEQQSNDMPAWHQQFNTVDRSKNDRQIAGMMKIASDPRLLQRDDIRGLADYLILREQVRKELEARAQGGMAKTLAAQENADLAQQWNDSVFSLVDSNLSFGSLYNRWLTNDDISGG